MDTKHSIIWTALVAVFFAAAENRYIVVETPPKDRAVLAGQSAELTCHIHRAKSKPNHIVQWVANSNRTGWGKPLSYNDRITVRDIPNKFSISTAKPYNLLIQNVDLDDAGKYTCNNVRTGKPIGGFDPQLIVLEPGPCLLQEITTIKEHEIITYTMYVRYAGNKDYSQKPTIKWTLNGFQQSAKADETKEGIFKSTITMAASSLDDQKELSCSFGVLNIQERCSTRLNIKYPARKPTLYIDGEEIDTDHNLKGGDVAILRGISEGNPEPSYTWQFKGRSGESFSPEEKGDTKQIKDAGVYRCCAKNSLNGYRKCSEIRIDDPADDPGSGTGDDGLPSTGGEVTCPEMDPFLGFDNPRPPGTPGKELGCAFGTGTELFTGGITTGAKLGFHLGKSSANH
ncbi:unnamed protein product [Owenia fusiformis]|uniref:Uncharacterized protein n=1 Tax=Owenia fusiformis TaxID=6347 RepID=A0A8J1TL50_OWEFU|nr:unnamed protein product [Owenia fusiformis]